MPWQRFGAAIVIFTLLAACSSDSPSVPGVLPPSVVPAVLRWQLTGTVTTNGAPLPDAVVHVWLEGASTGLSAGADASGRYLFASLEQGAFTVLAQAAGYAPATKALSLTTNSTLDFALVPRPFAHLIMALPYPDDDVRQPDGSYSVPLVAKNVGTGCGGSISGVTHFSTVVGGSASIQRVEWALAPTTIVPPSEVFTYTVCCLIRDEAFTGTDYISQFAYVTVACPGAN